MPVLSPTPPTGGIPAKELQDQSRNNSVVAMTQRENSRGCKIGRITAEYGFSDIDSRLAEDWQRETSIRLFTKDLIESERDAANVGHVEWSRTPVYETLHTDELSEVETIEVRRELDLAGLTSNS